jgi:predicted component of type VI protein secretion system
MTLDRPLDIGRDRGMPVALERDPQVSPRHARLTPQDGGAVVEDLGSAGGTFVNDQPIHSPRPVRPGDRLRVGLTVLEVRSAQQVEERPSAVHPRPRLTEIRHDVLSPETALPPQPAPPLQGVPEPAPVFQPGVGFRAAETPASYVPPEAVRDYDDDWDYGDITQMRDAPVKAQRNVAAFVLLGASALAVILYFGLS